jgi:hypothetical protein
MSVEPAEQKRPRRSICPRNKCLRFGDVCRVLHKTKISKDPIMSIEIAERTTTGTTCEIKSLSEIIQQILQLTQRSCLKLDVPEGTEYLVRVEFVGKT